MQQLLFIVHVLAAVGLIGLVLIQHGKGADAGAAFGSGASGTMFGSIGSMPFLIKVTGLMAAIFFTTSIALGYVSSKQIKQTSSIMEQAQVTQQLPLPTNNQTAPGKSN